MGGISDVVPNPIDEECVLLNEMKTRRLIKCRNHLKWFSIAKVQIKETKLVNYTCLLSCTNSSNDVDDRKCKNFGERKKGLKRTGIKKPHIFNIENQLFESLHFLRKITIEK